MKFDRKAKTVTGLLSLAACLALVANAEKVIQGPVNLATETIEMAYVSTLGTEYSIADTKNPIKIRVSEHPDTSHASLLVNGKEVMKFRSGYKGLSPALRAKRAANRLYAFLSVHGDARLIKPGLENEQVVIRVGREVLAHIDETTAQRSKNDVKHLALIWTNLTRKALGVGAIMRGAMPASRSMLNRDDFIDPASYKPAGPELKGMASWYGPGFHGRRAADGSRYNMYAMTAAHKSLPFGTMVRVRNERNGKTVVVRITDRGPYIHGRIIDLSKAAANAIGMPGIAPVTVEILKKDDNYKIPEPVVNPPSLKEMAKEIEATRQAQKEQPLDAPEELQPTEPLTEPLKNDPMQATPSTEMAVKTEQMVTDPAEKAEPATEEIINTQAIEEGPANGDESPVKPETDFIPEPGDDQAPSDPVDPDPLTQKPEGDTGESQS